jgi:hypothetical protein
MPATICSYRSHRLQPTTELSDLPLYRLLSALSVPPVPHDWPKFIMACLSAAGLLLFLAFQVCVTLLR